MNKPFIIIGLIGCFFGGCTQQVNESQEIKREVKSEPIQKLPIYQISWEVCVNNPNHLQGSDANGCLKNEKNLYVWGTEENSSFKPKAVLLRSQPVTRLSPTVFYRLYVEHQGCYPNSQEPGKLGYYWADATLLMDKKAYSQEVIKGLVKVDVRQIDAKEAEKIVILGNNAISLAGGNVICELSNFKE